MLLSQSMRAQNFSWAKSFGGTYYDEGRSVVVDNMGNIFIAGYFEGTVDFNPDSGTFNLKSVGGNDVFVSKFSASGNLIWAKRVGGFGNNHGNGIAIDKENNIYVTGYFNETTDFDPGSGIYNIIPPSPMKNNAFVLKLDSDGNFIWAKNFGGVPNSIDVDIEGNVYTTGYFNDSFDFDPGPGTYKLISTGNSDIFIVKLDNMGNFVWANSLKGSPKISESAESISIDKFGNILVTGDFTGTVDFDPSASTHYLTSMGWKDIFVLKLNSSGNLVWVKKMGGKSNDGGFSIAVDKEGNVYTTGIFRDTSDFDPGTGIQNSVASGDFDIFISKLDSNGDFKWARCVGGSQNDRGLSIDVDAGGNAYITGYFYSTADFDPGPRIYNLTSNGYSNIFILKLNSLGNFVSTKNIGGFDIDNGHSIFLDAFENIYITGGFYQTCYFDQDTLNNYTKSNGDRDVFIAKFNNSSSGIEEVFKNAVIFYPNPTNGKILISGNIENRNINSIEIIDFSGKTMIELLDFGKNQTLNTTIDISTFSSGLYFVKVKTNNEILIKKVVKR